MEYIQFTLNAVNTVSCLKDILLFSLPAADGEKRKAIAFMLRESYQTLKLVEKTQVVFVQQTHIVDVIAAHYNTL